MTASPPRRALLRSLTVSALGLPVLAACQRTGGSPSPDDQTPTAPTEPTQPLVIGRIVATFGLPGEFLPQLMAGMDEALIAVNTSGGLFGHDVQLLQAIQLTEPGQDISADIAALGEQGASAVIVAVPDEELLEILPDLVELQATIISPTSSAGALRGPDARTAGLLFRLAPTAATIATARFEQSSTAAQAGIQPGTIAVIGRDDFSTQDVLRELEDVMSPRGGSLVMRHLYAGDALGDAEALAREVIEKQPALLMLEGGPEVGAVAHELRRISDEEDLRFSIPIRMGILATRDYSGRGFVEDALQGAEGYVPGAQPPLAHQLEMLNQETGLATLDNPYAYSAHAYDAVVLVVLAARAATSVDGAAIARELPRVLLGNEECAAVDACVKALSDQLALGKSDGVAYQARLGALEFDENGDPAISDVQRATWASDSSLVWGDDTSLRAPQG